VPLIKYTACPGGELWHPWPVPLTLTTRSVTAGKFFRSGGQPFFVKALTYGPFRDEGGVRGRIVFEEDLDAVRESGANTVRVYTPPPENFLDACAERGLKVLAGLAWETHTDFLRERQIFPDIIRRCEHEVAVRAGHPALMGWFVANEIEAGLVRWMGPVRVQRALERLTEVLRCADGGALYAYANYPTTEYLTPRNTDFVAFNIYLEDRVTYAAYLARLGVLAGDRPLVISEFGCDVKAHGEDGQAETLRWFFEKNQAVGTAGATVFSFTDEWFRGGENVEGWAFGLTRSDRSRRPSFEVVKEAFAGEWLLPLEKTTPKISVVVCTYNGARTLRACLESLLGLDYPDYELVVVDDGSTDSSVREIVEVFDRVRYIRQEHAGLSVARNRGASEAAGEIIAYTDDDCIADPSWLRQIVTAFGDPGVVAAGGPNIPPEPRNLVEACVGLAPGAPAHVLLDDRRAEHLPGCNLVVRKVALEAVDGFRKPYVAAGDDVDFCWRLMDRGGEIVFVPSAMVWHHRRATVGAYLKQQIGYGRAEALLMTDHPQRFGRFGGARWDGVVYSHSPVSSADAGTRIYHGVMGYAPFQFIYSGAPFSWKYIAAGFRWVSYTFLLLCLGLAYPHMAVLPLAMLGCTLTLAVSRAAHVHVEGFWHGVPARALLVLLYLLQPVLRGAARYAGSQKFSRASSRGGHQWPDSLESPFWSLGERAFWSESGSGRESVLWALGEKLASFREVQTRVWRPFDFVVKDFMGGLYVFQSATEYHGHGNGLTRFRLRYCPGWWGWVFWMAAVLALVLGLVAGSGVSLFVGAVPGAIAVVNLLAKRRRLLEAVASAARECGLEKISR